MRLRNEISNFELLVPSKRIYLFTQHSIIAYWKTVCEYAREIRYVVASSRSNF